MRESRRDATSTACGETPKPLGVAPYEAAVGAVQGKVQRQRTATGSHSHFRLRVYLVSLKSIISPSAETLEFTEIERLQDFTESTNFTAC